MTLPSSGSISTDQIKSEIGVTGSITIPDANTRQLTGVSSGAIVIPNDFWGKSWATIALVGGTNSPFAPNGTLTATYIIGSNGIEEFDKTTSTSGTSTVSTHTWLLSGTASGYQFKATLTSGSTPSGTLNTWLGPTCSWSLTTTSSDSCTLSIQARDASTLAILQTVTVTLSPSVGS